MRAILIDPFERKITQVEYNNQFKEDGTYPGAYRLMQCDLIEVVYFDKVWEHAEMYVDEEGLFKQDLRFFIPLFSLGAQPIAGRALLVGPPDDEGNSTACPLMLEEVVTGIQFVDALE